VLAAAGARGGAGEVHAHEPLRRGHRRQLTPRDHAGAVDRQLAERLEPQAVGGGGRAAPEPRRRRPERERPRDDPSPGTQEAGPSVGDDPHDVLVEALVAHQLRHHDVEATRQLHLARPAVHDLQPVRDAVLAGQPLDHRQQQGLALDRHHASGSEPGRLDRPHAGAGADVEHGAARADDPCQRLTEGPLAAAVGEEGLVQQDEVLHAGEAVRAHAALSYAP
jgi:hypothetical protein